MTTWREGGKEGGREGRREGGREGGRYLVVEYEALVGVFHELVDR